MKGGHGSRAGRAPLCDAGPESEDDGSTRLCYLKTDTRYHLLFRGADSLSLNRPKDSTFRAPSGATATGDGPKTPNVGQK